MNLRGSPCLHGSSFFRPWHFPRGFCVQSRARSAAEGGKPLTERSKREDAQDQRAVAPKHMTSWGILAYTANMNGPEPLLKPFDGKGFMSLACQSRNVEL
jgi:hypothetical protein